MILIWLLPLVLILLAFAAFRGRGSGRSSDEGRGKTALDMLDEEYAKGRIDREEYLQRRKDLESSGRS
jgi:putative membrane protein